ncbi:MAG: hypothetical protein DDG60_00410 [Anaerolineae bacterium]|nr:MAG: hypothetical protein DDG60_00410 [Anaerolineae bacterium]
MNKKRNFPRFLGWFLALAFVVGCAGPGNGSGTQTSSGKILPTPIVNVTAAPKPEGTLRGFLEAWKADDYASMYGLLTPQSQQAIALEDFDKKYRAAMNALTLAALDYEILEMNAASPTSAQGKFRVTYKTNLFGEFQREMGISFRLVAGTWRVEWDDGLILPELAGGNRLSMDYQIPPRGVIYDRPLSANKERQPFVAQTQAYAIGLVPTNILPEQEPTLLSELGILLGLYPIQVLPIYDNRRDVYWYIPVGEAPASEVERRLGRLSSISGLVLTPYTARFYYGNGIAPQTIGYVSAVPAEEVDTYVRKGTSPGARVGRTGIELWGESYLAGKTGGTLYVVKPDGSLTEFAKAESQPASDVQLTIDRDFQVQVQRALEGFRGAIVVMERDTGRILAMASSPKFDPNIFEPNNANSPDGIQNLFNDLNRPLVNRATQGQLPLGSVFKVITFAAALESGTYTPDLKLECGYEWTGLSDKIRYDWTWERCQKELSRTGTCNTRPSGELTLSQGLMRSCNPWFWHIGLDLYRQGRVTAIADMARAFGLGQPTGISVIDESAGNITNPAGEVEAVNQAIGQGDVLVTPLQVARFMAAIGNGGTLYRPQLVEKIIGPDGTETVVFKPEAMGTLPLKPETLAALQKAMREVIINPRGTASHRFRGMQTPIYGKTGTAESGSGLPHSWFAGYTDAQNPDLPDIAIAVVVENMGEGSEYATPIFRRVVEIYFTGQPRSLFWWESNFGITRTPTPFGFEGTATMEAQPNP